MTDDVAESISTKPASLQRARPPAQIVDTANLAATSNGTQTNRNSKSATARLMRNDDVTLEPDYTHTSSDKLITTRTHPLNHAQKHSALN